MGKFNQQGLRRGLKIFGGVFLFSVASVGQAAATTCNSASGGTLDYLGKVCGIPPGDGSSRTTYPTCSDLVKAEASFAFWGPCVQEGSSGSLPPKITFGSPKAVGQTGNFVRLADINADGKADLIQVEPDGAIIVQFNLGTIGDSTWSRSQPIGKTANKVYFADLNGDGMADLIERAADGPILVHLMKADLTMHSPVKIGATGNELYFADLNGDSKVDILQHVLADGQIDFLLNRGNLHFNSPGKAGLTNNAILVCDVNGDGRADLLEVEPSGIIFARAQIKNAEGGDVQWGQAELVGNTANKLPYCANLNGDRFADLLVMDPKGNLEVLLNTSAGSQP